VRSPSEIGAGLDPPRPPRPVRAGERIHVVGIAGAGASGAALLAHWAGARVTGCDAGGPSPYLEPLQAAGIEIAWEHDPSHLNGPGGRPERLAVTKALTAVNPHHPELVTARRLGIPVEPWQQLVADVAVGRQLVAVAGTHGKGTTAAWLLHLLAAAGRDPAGFVGALLPPSLTGGLPATARWGRGGFVVEADEYAGNFDPYRPDLAVVTNLDWDHPDVFPDRAAVVSTVEAWLRRGGAGLDQPHPEVVVNVADPGGRELAQRLADWPRPLVVTSLFTDPLADSATRSSLRAAGAALRRAAEALAATATTRGGEAHALVGRPIGLGPAGSRLLVAGTFPGCDGVVTLRIRLVGTHQAANGLLAFAAGLALGIPLATAVEALGTFPGVGRRLERKGSGDGVVVYDDYAHHPTALEATLAALRLVAPGRRIWVAHEPLTFHRTAALLEPLARALAVADGVVVAPIWAGRDRDRPVSANDLVEAVRRLRPDRTAIAPPTLSAAADWLVAHLEPGDVLLVTGGGHSYRLAELVLAGLRRRARHRRTARRAAPGGTTGEPPSGHT
jgi:UDP-N-acetylmuramate--alanine ligase